MLVVANLNKAFESRIRLSIMSVVLVNDGMESVELKEILNAIDGNLASHLMVLEI